MISVLWCNAFYAERGHDPFDILPEGWLALTHTSGMPVYLHKQLRVCSLSRPYFLGPGSARVCWYFHSVLKCWGHSIVCRCLSCALHFLFNYRLLSMLHIITTQRPYRHRTWTVQSYSPGGTNVLLHLIHASLAHSSPQPKRHLNRFIRFCRAHDSDRLSVTIGHICMHNTAMQLNNKIMFLWCLSLKLQ